MHISATVKVVGRVCLSYFGLHFGLRLLLRTLVLLNHKVNCSLGVIQVKFVVLFLVTNTLVLSKSLLRIICVYVSDFCSGVFGSVGSKSTEYALLNVAVSSGKPIWGQHVTALFVRSGVKAWNVVRLLVFGSRCTAHWVEQQKGRVMHCLLRESFV